MRWSLAPPPNSDFALSSTGKADITASVEQSKTEFTYADGVRIGQSVKATGTVTAHNMTAGKWHGQYQFNIGLKSYEKANKMMSAIKLTNRKSLNVQDEAVAKNGVRCVFTENGNMMYFYVDADYYNLDLSKAVCKFNEQDKTEFTYRFSKITQSEDEFYGSYFTAIAANFSNAIRTNTISVYADSSSEEPVCELQFTLQDYLNNIINSSSDEKLVALAKAMSDLYNSRINLGSADPSTASFYNSEIKNVSENIPVTGESDYDKEKFPVTSHLVSNQTRACFATQDNTVQATSDNAEATMLNGMWCVRNKDCIQPMDYDKTFTLGTTGGNITTSINISLRDYISRAVKGLSNQAVGSANYNSYLNAIYAAKAIYYYGVAARNYFN